MDAALPTGTITFLFTDIEGSTKLWEQNAPAMQATLARHDEILRRAIEGHGGYVFKTVGDAFCAAFATAPDALEAALELQRSLQEEQWPQTGPLRVRVALHTGATEERDGDYFGPPVNRVARLLSAAHGGQVLLSGVTRDLARDHLGTGMELRDLGEHRLKDLFRPERVFQLSAPGLPSQFPPLRTLESRPNNLPLQPTPLVGREREVAQVTQLLRSEEVRLLTLTGPGGTGKSRLALQAAADVLEEFEDGIFFVALEPITDPGLVSSAISQPLGVKESGDQPLEESLKGYLKDKHLLLLLDNFEQVLEGATLVGELVAACPNLKVLVTSRTPLRLYGEREYLVPPMGLPDLRHPQPPERLTQYEAVRLFIGRAKDVKADFEVTNESAPAVAEICVRLDGLPLAIELAAARVRLLPPQAMLARLGNRLKLLKGGARDLPERQRTLRGAIDWSYELLEEEERTLFARLAVFSGGCTLEAIEAICDAEGELDALEGVESLVQKSLLRQEEGPGGEPRFVMLETIHEYANERLQESGEAEAVRRRHAEYYLAVAEEAEPRLMGPDRAAWVERLEHEHDNVRAALAWSLHGGAAELGLRLAGAMFYYWLTRGHLEEGQNWLEEALADGGTPSPARSKALKGAGALVWQRGDRELAKEYFERSLAMSRELGDKRGESRAMTNLGLAAISLGDYASGRELLESGLMINRELGDTRGVAYSLGELGNLAFFQSEFEQASKYFEQALTLHQKLGDKRSIGLTMNNLGAVARRTGELQEATELLKQSLAVAREIRDDWLSTSILVEAAGLLAQQDRTDRTALLLAAADKIRQQLGFEFLPDDLAEYVRTLQEVREKLGEQAFEAVWSLGLAMTLEEAVSYALEEEASG